MPSLSRLMWSDDIDQAAWIGERLTPPGEKGATVFVPSGFEAYARILHPAEEPRWGERLVRWREVAAWSGLPLDPYAEFASVALPPEPVEVPPPWSGQGRPRQGSLFPPDAAVAIDHLRRHMATADRCWFCLWAGYGWTAALIPDSVESGPKIRLPDRDYYLYNGPVDSALISELEEPPDHTANLWSPPCLVRGERDRSVVDVRRWIG